MAANNVPPNSAPDDGAWDSAAENNDDGTSPFGTGPVDPLVFVDDGTSPELRPAAQYVPIGPRLTLRPPAPAPKTKKAYKPWTPGTPAGASTPAAPTPRATGWGALVRVLVAIAIAAAPLLLVSFLIRAAIDLYQDPADTAPAPTVEATVSAPATPGASR